MFELCFQSGLKDILIEQANLVIHQPTIREISQIDEKVFFTGCELFKFSKNSLLEQDKERLGNLTDFDIIMSIINDTSDEGSRSSTQDALSVLSLLFPSCDIIFEKNEILIQDENNGRKFIINNNNFPLFKNFLIDMFCLKTTMQKEYNPAGELSKKIADKIKKGKNKVAIEKNKNEDDNQKTSILGRYISILAVGERKDKNELSNYTIYQLYDEFQRFQLKEKSDIVTKARLAGQTKIQDPEDWMKELSEKDLQS